MKRAERGAGGDERAERLLPLHAGQVEHDVAFSDDARIGEGRRQRRDRVVAHGQHDDGDLANPGRRLAPISHRQGERCWYAFLVSPVEADRITCLGQCESQSDTRATGPDEPDRAGRL